ncbi:MAG: Trp biosynthesis-associated membrane protein [Mycetocola sp.]
MSGSTRLRRVKSSVVLLTIVVSGLVLIGATQQWYLVTIEPEPGVVETLPADGQTLVPVLAGLGLTGLALAAALTLVGRGFRCVLGAILTLIGVAVTWATIGVIQNPGAAAGPAVTERTGIAGAESVARIVTGTDAAVWPWLTLALGVIVVLCGVVVLLTGARWPQSSRKYETANASAHNDTSDGSDAGPVESIGGWDELSRGEDPTR